MMLHGIRYFGGKSAKFRNGAGPWIAKMLPYRRMYVEPFAGMLGVLLQREKSRIELVNDRDGMISAFWECIRDYPDKLEWKFANAPIDRVLFNKSIEIKNKHLNGEDIDKVDLAFAVGVILLYGFGGKNEGKGQGYCCIFPQPTFETAYKFSKRISLLHKRIIDVRVENCDVLEILDKTKKHSDCVVYCDPPYLQARSGYSAGLDCKQELVDMLKAQNGAVAISGYNDDWDDLDWYKETKRVKTTVAGMAGDNFENVEMVRMETIWSNYKLVKNKSLLDL